MTNIDSEKQKHLDGDLMSDPRETFITPAVSTETRIAIIVPCSDFTNTVHSYSQPWWEGGHKMFFTLSCSNNRKSAKVNPLVGLLETGSQTWMRD